MPAAFFREDGDRFVPSEDAVTHVDGLGLSDTALWDERGRIGRAAQTLLVRRRPMGED